MAEKPICIVIYIYIYIIFWSKSIIKKNSDPEDKRSYHYILHVSIPKLRALTRFATHWIHIISTTKEFPLCCHIHHNDGMQMSLEIY